MANEPVLVDSNVILDVLGHDATWQSWSASAIERSVSSSYVAINPVIYAEVSILFSRIEDLEDAVPSELFRREQLPCEAAFVAGKCFVEYRKRGGTRTTPLPDFFIGAHALVAGYRLLTRNARRFRTYFPALTLIAP